MVTGFDRYCRKKPTNWGKPIEFLRIFINHRIKIRSNFNVKRKLKLHMALPRKTNSDQKKNGAKIFEVALGLDEFLKVIEKDFFTEAKISFNYDVQSKKSDIVLDLHFNFGITESMKFLNAGSWGGLVFPYPGQKVSSSFETAFVELNALNNNALDISEMSLYFKDTSIVISRLYAHSIPKELGNILLNLSKHFVYYTKGLTEMPYEIFVPVFEDKDPQAIGPKEGTNGYFDYWGLYYEDDSQQVMIYSLRKKKMYEVDLFLFE